MTRLADDTPPLRWTFENPEGATIFVHHAAEIMPAQDRLHLARLLRAVADELEEGARTAQMAWLARGQALTGKDRLLTVEEAAQKLGRSKDWLYRHAGRLPFTVRDGRLLRFSEQGIERYIRQRQGRNRA